MSSMTKNMLKLGIFAVGVFGFALFVNAADDACGPMPDCEALGYVKNANCKQNTYISCPYDTSYKKCVNPDCEALGYTMTDKKSWCKTIVSCPTDSSFTLCREKCAGCATGELEPDCPFGLLSAGTDECGNQCYTCAACTYDTESRYTDDTYASLQCSTSQYIQTVIKPLCPENTALKYVCESCPLGMIAPNVNSASCICDEVNGYYRTCPTGAYCESIHTKAFGTCYKPTEFKASDSCPVTDPNYPDCEEPCVENDPRPWCQTGFCITNPEECGDNYCEEHPEATDCAEQCLENPRPTWCLKLCKKANSPEWCNNDYIEPDPCEEHPEECVNCEYCDPLKGYVCHSINDPHFTYGPIEEIRIDATKTAQCKKVTGCNASVEGSKDSPDFTKTYFEVLQKTLPEKGGPTCYWVNGCIGDPYVEAANTTADPCCEGRIYRNKKTEGEHTCGLCPCKGDVEVSEGTPLSGSVLSRSYYKNTPLGRLFATNQCSYQTCNHATECDVEGQHYSSSWDDQHFIYGTYVELPQCKEVLRCNSEVQGARANDFDATQKSYFTTSSVTNGARTCYFVTGCNAANNPKRENNCDAEELRWVSGDPQYLGGYTCGTCECDRANGFYETCPTGATCKKIDRCYQTIKGGADDPDNDGCNNTQGYVPSSTSQISDVNKHFSFGDTVSFYIGSTNTRCTLVTGCKNNVDGATERAADINGTYHTSTSATLPSSGPVTCHWVTGCADTRVYTSGNSYGHCSIERGYRDTTCHTYGGKHCCVCETFPCAEQYDRSTPAYIKHTTSSTVTNYTCESTDKKEADQTCYDCVCDTTHCNGTECGTQTVDCPDSTYPYKYCQHAVRGNSCDTITRANDTHCKTVETDDYITKYEKCDCINNGTNECYKRNTSNDDCTPLVCADYTDYPLESNQIDTTGYVYEEKSKCSGETTRKCYKKKGCNATKGYYDSEEACLAANDCYSSCKKDATYTDCYVINTKKTCAYDTGHTSASCNSTCFDCSDKEKYCGIEYCYNLVALGCRGDYPLDACPTDHKCEKGSVSVGTVSTGACSNKYCYQDKGCDEGSRRYDSEERCIEKETGYSSCQQLTSGCWMYKDAKTCADYSMSATCNGSCYNCPSSKKLLGETEKDCYSPEAKTCTDYSMSDSCSEDCYKCTPVEKCTGDHNSNCYSPVLKTCAELGYSASNEACVNAHSGYQCKKASVCSQECYTTDSCDSSHCGDNCATASKTCDASVYKYVPYGSQGGSLTSGTLMWLPENSNGKDACYPACQTGTASYTRYKDFTCLDGYTRFCETQSGKCTCSDCREYTPANGWYKDNRKPSDYNTTCYHEATVTCAGTTYTKYEPYEDDCDIHLFSYSDTTGSDHIMYAWFDRVNGYEFEYKWVAKPACKCQLNIISGPNVYTYPVQNVTECPLGLYQTRQGQTEIGIYEYCGYIRLPSNADVMCEGFWPEFTSLHMDMDCLRRFGDAYHDDQWGMYNKGNCSNCNYYNKMRGQGSASTCVEDKMLMYDGVSHQYVNSIPNYYSGTAWPHPRKACVECSGGGADCVSVSQQNTYYCSIGQWQVHECESACR